jgi:hypothetical protein
MLRLDRTAPRIGSARKLVPSVALPHGTSDILAVALRTQLLGGAGPEPSHKSQVRFPAVFPVGRGTSKLGGSIYIARSMRAVETISAASLNAITRSLSLDARRLGPIQATI